MSLADKKCIPCEGGTPPLKSEEINKYLVELEGDWKVSDNKKISRTFVFKNFKDAIAFVNKVAKIAEEESHHPDIRIYTYKKVDIELSTHAIGGLSENDFILAAKIEVI